VDEPSLSYRLEGDGAPLLLVHGFGIPYNIWNNLVPLLRRHFRLVMIELPGIGASPMPPQGQDYLAAAIEGIDQVRRALGYEKWDVLGYSSGSRIAEAYVQSYAAQVCRAIFLCPLKITIHKARALRFGLRMDRSLPVLGEWILSGWRLRFLISWLGFNLKRDPRGDEWYAEISAVPKAALRETLRAMAPLAMRPFSVPVRYILIWGDKDLVPETPLAADEHNRFVHGRHAAPLESAQEIAAILVSQRESID
jgi:pimeloyl-ACP methyl ester carboxylesterase